MVHIERRGAGPPVVLLAGAPHPPWDFEQLTDRLMDRAQVHLVHQPGWGRSGRFVSLAAGQQEILALLPPDAILVGFGAGFWRALDLVHRGYSPRALMGISPMARFDLPTRNMMQANADLLHAGVQLGGLLIRRMLSPAHAAGRPGDAADVAKFLDAAPLSDVSAEQAAFAVAPDRDEALADVTAPVTLRCGELDALQPPSEVHALAAHRPGTPVTVVPGAGHLLTREDPDGTAAALLALL